MSHLTPGRLPVGYSVTRKDMDRPQFDKSRLPQFDRIPDRKAGLVPLMFRFALHGRSWWPCLAKERDHNGFKGGS